MKNLIGAFLVAWLFSGCAMHNPPCEEATVAAEQMQQCLVLQRQIVQAKDKPIIRTELERRYQLDCVDIRYYRDDHRLQKCDVKGKDSNK